MVDDSENIGPRLENMRNQIPGKDKKPEERKRTKERKQAETREKNKRKKNKNCNKNHFKFGLFQQCIAVSMISYVSFYCFSPYK